MDITLAQTFLEIVATGSFMRAAERLHVTATAVSARVRKLEDSLGRKLFVRNKAGSNRPASTSCATRRAWCSCGNGLATRCPCRPAGVRWSPWAAR